MKRYRLKIPEMVHKDYCKLVSDIYTQRECKKHPTCKATEPGHTLVQMCTIGEQTYSVPSDWLEEIKDGPRSESEVIRDILGMEDSEYVDFGSYVVTWKNLVSLVRAGAAENEKKHQLQQSFEEWNKHKITPIRTAMSPQEILKLGREQGWQAHAKATNTES